MSTVLLALALAVAGGLGSVCRVLVDTAVRERWAVTFPAGVVVVNITGSFLLGAAYALLPDTALLLVVGTGFLGGYTTFSTAMVDAVNLLRSGRVRTAVAALLAGWVLSVGAAALGLAIGTVVTGPIVR